MSAKPLWDRADRRLWDRADRPLWERVTPPQALEAALMWAELRERGVPWIPGMWCVQHGARLVFLGVEPPSGGAVIGPHTRRKYHFAIEGGARPRLWHIDAPPESQLIRPLFEHEATVGCLAQLARKLWARSIRPEFAADIHTKLASPKGWVLVGVHGLVRLSGAHESEAVACLDGIGRALDGGGG